MTRYGNAIAQKIPTLEVPDRGEITEKVSRRLAILASTKFHNMQDTFEKFKKLYKRRSDILHGIDISEVSSQFRPSKSSIVVGFRYNLVQNMLDNSFYRVKPTILHVKGLSNQMP